jgi:hypothetical protein
VLDLEQPLAAGRQFRGFDGEARRDAPGREGKLQHAEQIKLDNGDCNLMGRRWLSLECVSCFTLGPARTFYRREITEQIGDGGRFPTIALLGVSSLNWAPLAAARGVFFHSAPRL